MRDGILQAVACILVIVYVLPVVLPQIAILAGLAISYLGEDVWPVLALSAALVVGVVAFYLRVPRVP